MPLIDRTAKAALDTNLNNGVTSDAPKLKASNDVVYNTMDANYNEMLAALTTIYNSDKFSQLGIINVKDKTYGAKGDGVTDDTTAIQAALTALVAGSGELIFPAGTYKVTSAITATILAGKQIKIRGYGKVVIQSTVPDPADFNTTGIFTLTGTTTSILLIENIDIEHTYASADRGELQGIRIATFQEVYLEKVTVNNAPDVGIQLVNVGRGMAAECICTSNNYTGFGMRGTTDFHILGGGFHTNGGNNSGTQEGYGISCMTCDPDDIVHNERIIIDGAYCSDNVGKGIDAHDCLGFTVKNCRIEGFNYNGIYAVNESSTKAVSDVTLHNNVIDGTGATAVSGLFGIQVGCVGTLQTIDFNDAHITGNTIRNITVPTSYGIMIENAATGGKSPKKVVIAHNIMENAAPSDGAIIRSNSSTLAIDNIIVSDNILHAASCANGIALNLASRATIKGNILVVDSGTVSVGISTGSLCHAIYEGNVVEGGATYTADIEVYSEAYQIARNNLVNGAPKRDYMNTGITIEIGSAAPTAGFYKKGSIVWNAGAAASGKAGWINTVTGTPGTWNAFGAIDA